MKNTFKKLFISFTVLSLTACSSTTMQDNTFAAKENKDFTKYTNQLVVEYAENDYTTMHQFFEHPKDYGIDINNVDVSLSEFYTDNTEEIKEDQKELNKFNRSTLDKTQQTIYDELKYENELSLKAENKKFQYLNNCWSTMSGLHQSLISVFSEYILRNEKDIQDLITLINDVPRYTNDVLEYTKEQADKNTLQFDYDSVTQDIQDVINNKADSSITSALYNAIDALNLDEEKTTSYKAQVKDAMDTSFFTSYQAMLDTLTSLQYNVQPLQGLSNYKNGKKYYEVLVENATSSTDSISTIKENTQSAINSSITKFQKLYKANPMISYELDSVSTDFTDVNQILESLQKNYKKDFPKVKTMKYDLKALPEDQSVSGIVAYFITPALDYSQNYQMRYNKRDYGDDPSSLTLYQTLAHEGIAGHMYQAQYNKEHLKYPIQFFYNNLGMSEGWATYMESMSLHYLDNNKDLLEAYNLNNILTNLYIVLMDISIHYDGMSLNDFKNEYGDMFRSEGLESIYNQLADNPTVFLSYYYGYLQIVDLKSTAQSRLRSKFDNADFHNALLQYGEVNFNIVKQSVNEYINKNR